MKSPAPWLLLVGVLVTLTLSQAQDLVVPSDGDRPGVRTQGEPLVHGRAVEVITFEGIADGSPVGTIGPVTFGGSWTGLVDTDAGGFGNIANEPSPSTVAWTDSLEAVTFASPVGSVSFMYTLNTNGGTPAVTFRDTAGNTLGTRTMDVCGATPCGNTCGGDPAGEFCAWASISFDVSSPPGVASFDINGARGRWAIDDLTYDTTVVPVEVQSFSVE